METSTSEVSLQAVIFGAACLPMFAVYFFGLSNVVLTERFRRFMYLSWPLMLIGALAVKFLYVDSSLYAASLTAPYAQWLVVRILHERFVLKHGRTPRSGPVRMREGDTIADWTFNVAYGIGMLIATALVVVVFLAPWRW